MPGAELGLLQNPDQIRRIDRRAHCLATVAVDDTQRLWAEVASRVDDM